MIMVLKRISSNGRSGAKEPEDEFPRLKAITRFHKSAYEINGSSEALFDDCPFCGGQKFYFNVEKGLYSCKSGSCGKEGNLVEFLQWSHENAFEITLDAHYTRLKRRRGIPLQTLKRHGLAFHDQLNCWLIPARGAKGTVVNILRYFEDMEGNNKFWTPSLPSSLIGLDQVSSDITKPLFVVEGPFDLMAIDRHLRKNKHRDRYDIIAVPGSRTFKEEWCEQFRDRTVNLWFDNDPAGNEGYEHILKRFREANVPVTLKRLIWPCDYPAKYDVNDLVKNTPKLSLPTFYRKHSTELEYDDGFEFNFTRASSVQHVERSFLWEDRIPLKTMVTLGRDVGQAAPAILFCTVLQNPIRSSRLPATPTQPVRAPKGFLPC